LGNEDAFFQRNWKKSKNAGLVRGAYHFFLATKSGKAQAENFINSVELSPGDLPPVLGDRVQLQQVLLNLIMNGIEGMSALVDRPRELSISAQKDELDQVRVTVQDSGIGLDQQGMERIFRAFYTTKPQGMGIGLSISRSIIETHGGRLWAERSERPGATFQFTLPVYEPSAA